MQIVNTLTGTRPLFAHAQGPSSKRPLWRRVVEDTINKPIIFPDAKDVTVVTFITPGLSNILGVQYKNAGIDFINLAENHSGQWNNTFKIVYFHEFLKQVKTEYVLSLDSIDVLTVNDLTTLLPKFNQFDCNIVFGATRNMYPPNLFELPTGNTGWPYLNSGTVMGRPKALEDFYKIIVESLSIKYEEYNNSEQGRIKRAIPNYDKDVKFDYNCELFQTMFGVSHRYKNDILEITGLGKIE